MLALFENPFFVRECRLAWRRRFTPFHWVVASVAVSAGMLLLLLLGDAISPRQPGPRVASSAWWLLLPHLLTCMIAAGKSSGRTIGAAASRKPSEPEFLVLLEPTEWVLGKMAYPFALTAIVWAAPIPMLLVAGVFDVVGRQELVDYLGVLLLVPIASIPASFLPQDVQTAEPKPVVAPREPFDEVSHWLGTTVRVGLWIAWPITGFLGLLRPFLQLYNLTVPTGLPIGICCLAGALCGWYAGEMSYLRTGCAQVRFLRSAHAALAVLYVVPVGVFWGWMRWWLRALVLCAGPTYIAFRRTSIGRGPGRKRRPSPLTPLSLRELEWFERNRPNALTRLDLGRALRARSPAAAFLGGIAAIAAPAVSLVFRQPRSVLLAALMVGVVALLSLGTAFGAVRAVWDSDRKAGFLESLFLTPQSSEELVAGRVAAAAGSHGVQVLGMSAAMGVFVGWVAGWHGGLPVWIFLALPSAVFVAWLAIGIAETDAARTFFRREDVPNLLLVFGVAPAALYASIVGSQGWLAMVWLWACRLSILFATAVLARRLFRFRVAELDRLRCGQE